MENKDYLQIFTAVLQGMMANPNHGTDKLILPEAIAAAVDEISRAAYQQFKKTKFDFSIERVERLKNRIRKSNEDIKDGHPGFSK